MNLTSHTMGVLFYLPGGEPEARGTGQRPLRVLAIGNSYTQSLVPEFPQVARAAGCSLDLAILAIGGNSLSNHWMHCAAARERCPPTTLSAMKPSSRFVRPAPEGRQSPRRKKSSATAPP